jgi:PAS domain S-box-containing protein
MVNYLYKIVFIANEDQSPIISSEWFKNENLQVIHISEYNSSTNFFVKNKEQIDLILIDIDVNEKNNAAFFLEKTLSNFQIPIIFITPPDINETFFNRLIQLNPFDIIQNNSNSLILKNKIKQALCIKGTQTDENADLVSQAPKQYYIEYINKLENALKTSENRFHYLFNRSPFPIWEEDFSQIKSYFDRLRDLGVCDFRVHFDSHFEDVFKCASLVKILDVNHMDSDDPLNNEKKIIPGNLTDIFSEESYQIFKEELICLAEGNTTYEGELRLKNVNGEITYSIVRLFVVSGFEHSLEHVMVSFFDITDRKKSETALLKSEKQFKQVWNNAVDGMRIIDIEGKITSVNDAFCTLIGKSKEELIGKNFSVIYDDQNLENPDLGDQEEKLRKFKGKISDNDIEPRFRKELVLWNGKKVWFEVSNSILNTEEDNLSVLSIFRDISIRMNYEARLNQTTEELKEINASKDKFISILSHDLRGPFNGFLGITDILANSLESLTPEEIKESATLLNKALKNLYLLLDDLLLWSRIQTRRINFVISTFHVVPEVESVISLLTPNAEKKRIKIINNINANLELTADKSMLKLLFRNLIANAIKFTFEGGAINLNAYITDELKTSFSNSNYSSFVFNPKSIIFCVSDSGAGISTENMSKLFRSDIHFTTTGTQNETGTGLGLVLCKEIVEKHNGYIWAESDEGIGSSFYFTLSDVQKQ